MDFGELKNDKDFIEKSKQLDEALDNIENSVDLIYNTKQYDSLSTDDKVTYDIFLSYTANSLFWAYVKLQGKDVNAHGIKNELSRVRQALVRQKDIRDRNTIRPVLDKGAAGRFIRHGLWEPKKIKNDDNNDTPNKRKKFK